MSFRFLGAISANGEYDEHAKLQARTQVAFEWQVLGHEYDEQRVVLILCDNIRKRKNVPLPDNWSTALNIGEIKKAMIQSQGDGNTFLFASSVHCTLLGLPRQVFPEPIGAVHLLRSAGGEVREHLLCAHVENNAWICRAGSQGDTPFAAVDLSERDVVAHAHSGRKPNKRV